MSDEPVSVYVADDHPIYREGLVGAIRARPDLDLVGEAANGRDALDAIRDLRPQVAVLDLSMPEMTGFEVLSAIQREELPTRVVVLSASDESESVFRAVAEGAVAYVPKDSGREDVCEAIAAAGRGEVVLAAGVQSGLADQIRHHGRSGQPTLTQLERDVLRLSGEGLSPPEIGYQLHIGSSAVKAEIAAACEKLGAADRAAAVAAARQQGLLG
jgi:two-component system nitrate/nitrite response regulator NarL